MTLVVRPLGLQDYTSLWQAMRRFADTVPAEQSGEIWLVQHPPIYTLGLKASQAHLLCPPEDIPIHTTDRGGQVTYHGPGQLILYPLLNLKYNGLSVRALVHGLEHSVISLLDAYGIGAHARADAPGVYVGEAKIASLGLKVRKGVSYHGIALNWRMDLTPFSHINPCGLKDQTMTQLCDLMNPCPDEQTLWHNWVDTLVAELSLPCPRWVRPTT